jgi:transcriptional regulator with XRE-family HTH domain
MRLGAVVRAVRLRKGWRQRDVAAAARVSGPTVSRIEQGRVSGMSLRHLEAVATALDIRLDVVARWRGGELDRMLNAGHAALHEAAARELSRSDWLQAPEATFSIYGERGAMDVLAFHRATGALLVVELKTQLVDVQELVGAVDRYRRLAPQIARERGWHPTSVSAWIALRESPSNHRRLARHATVLRGAFPSDGRRMRGWLRDPIGTVSALSFLSDVRGRNVIASSAGVQRVRRRGVRVGQPDHPA